MKAISRVLLPCIAAAVAAASRADGDWTSRLPIQDTFVNYNSKGTTYGSETGAIVGNGRETCLVFDVSDLANVTSARLSLYVIQATGAAYSQPIYVRVMRDDTWDENTLTWNSLPDEFRVSPSPWIGAGDPSLAGFVENAAGTAGTWLRVDITDAVKAAAIRGNRRLALHLFTPWTSTGSSDNTPLAFYSKEYSDDPTLRTTLDFQGETTGAAFAGGILPEADAFIWKGENANKPQGTGENIVVDKDAGRKGLMRFDLSSIPCSSVASAVLRVRMHATQNNMRTGSLVQFRLFDDDSWNEATVTWNNPPQGVTPSEVWGDATPGDAVRVGSVGANQFYDIELAPLVNKTLAAGKTKMSLFISMNNASATYFVFHTKEVATEAYRPRLYVLPVGAPSARAERAPERETFVSSFYNERTGASNKDSNYSAYDGGKYMQIGCSGDKVQYGLVSFNADGLENAGSVRVRFRARKQIASATTGSGYLRVAAWTTPDWDEKKITWNTTAPFFPAPETVTAETEIEGETSAIDSITVNYLPYLEADVTAAAREAARSGKKLTVGLFSNFAWPEIQKSSNDDPPVLIFPDPDATFGARVTSSLDTTGETPALKLAWSPSKDDGATYTVHRKKGDAWTKVADNLAEAVCLDDRAVPWQEHTYRITAALADGTTESVEKTVLFEPRSTLFAEADTYVRNGASYQNTSFGSDVTAVLRYSSGDNDSNTREGFMRFDVSAMPDRFTSATLKLNLTGEAGSPDNANGHLDLFEYPDFEWSDASAPSWNDVFGNGYATPRARSSQPDTKREAETSLGQWLCSKSGPLPVNAPIEFDITDAIRSAKASGKSHITLHTAVYATTAWNFGIITRERAQGVSCAPQIEFALKNWVARGTVIIIR